MRLFLCLIDKSIIPMKEIANNQWNLFLFSLAVAPIINCYSNTAYLGERNSVLRCEIKARPGLNALYWMLSQNGTIISQGQQPFNGEYQTVVKVRFLFVHFRAEFQEIWKKYLMDFHGIFFITKTCKLSVDKTFPLGVRHNTISEIKTQVTWVSRHLSN